MKAFLLDLGFTAVFVAIGMSSHGSSWSQYPQTALPFIAALVIAWAFPLVHKQPTSLIAGAVVWAITTAGGLGIRAVMGDGVSGAFPIITAAVLAAFFFGWRIIAFLVQRRKATPSGSSHQ